jgi:hypothetical protein
MLALLPLSCFVLLFFGFSRRCLPGKAAGCWRTGFLAAALVWGCLVTAQTEFLSFFQAITPPWLSLLWTAALLAPNVFSV